MALKTAINMGLYGIITPVKDQKGFHVGGLHIDGNCGRLKTVLQTQNVRWSCWSCVIRHPRATWSGIEIFIVGICVSMAPRRDGISSIWRLSLQGRCYSSRLLTERQSGNCRTSRRCCKDIIAQHTRSGHRCWKYRCSTNTTRASSCQQLQ